MAIALAALILMLSACAASGAVYSRVQVGDRIDLTLKRLNGRFDQTLYADAAIQAAFASGAHRIYAECDPENEASWRLLESLGFAREAHFRKNVYFKKDSSGNPIWKDTFVYSLLNE